jgi:S-formylglutathione hydrolase FrmB
MRRFAPLLAMLMAVAAAPAAHAESQVKEIAIPVRSGKIADKWIGYAAPPRARVLLPDGYDAAKAYPLLLLLHGANSGYKSWSEPGKIAKVAAGFPGIVVMPEGGTGMYADWWNGGKRGDPSWESYLLEDVVPAVLERFRIRPERRWHALAGVSMGGLGAAYLGGRLPGFFGSIAVISGVVDGHLYPGYGAAQSLIPQSLAGEPGDPEAVMGPEQGFYSYGHDPVRLAANLAETRVYMAAGDGTPDPGDGEPTANNPAVDGPLEGGVVRPASDNYAAALRAAGADLTYQPHAGIHDWPNFRRELRDAIKWGLFEPVAERPSSWVNDTVATRGTLWDVGYRFDAPPDRIVRFRRVGGRLAVGAAGSPVTLTTDGGCVVRVSTPAAVDVPSRPCRKLAVSVTPKRVRTGSRTRVEVRVRPAVAGAVVRFGGGSARTDARGVARLAVCLRGPGLRRVTVTSAGYAPSVASVRAVGTARSCS